MCWWRRLREPKCASSSLMVTFSRCTPLQNQLYVHPKSYVAGKSVNVNFFPGGIWGDTCNHYRLLPFPRWGGGPTDLQQPSWGPGSVSGFRYYPSNTQKYPHTKRILQNMILRGGALTKEATISLTFIGQWSSTTRFLIRVLIWGHYPDFCPFRTVGTNSGQGATCCGCTISSPRFTVQNVSTSIICNSCRWLLRARSTIQTRPKRRPNSTNQVEHENLVIIAKMQVCFIFEMNLRAQTFRPLENERLEEAAAGVQLGCWVGEAGGGEGGRHVKGSWHLATSILKCDRCDCVFATSNHAEEVKR